MGKIKPDWNPNDRNHKYIWDILGFKVTEEDFQAIEDILTRRKVDHERIDGSVVMWTPFDEVDEYVSMWQPRSVPDHVREGAHRYVNWSCAVDIWMILSKYASFYSKN